MHGKIFFPDTESLVEWQILITGKTTATWECHRDPNRAGGWIVEFQGGY